MIKKISLLVLLLMCSISFAQENNKKEIELKQQKETANKKGYSESPSVIYDNLKKKIPALADYFSSELRFTTKQKSNFIEIFSNYVHKISKLEGKGKVKSKDEYLKLEMKFIEERDEAVKSTLNRRQKQKYQELLKKINYRTFEIKK